MELVEPVCQLVLVAELSRVPVFPVCEPVLQVCLVRKLVFHLHLYLLRNLHRQHLLLRLIFLQLLLR